MNFALNDLTLSAKTEEERPFCLACHKTTTAFTRRRGVLLEQESNIDVTTPS